MTDLPTPPHKIGDTLYYPSIDSETTKHPCPDCLGTKIWKLTVPAGYDLDVACQRCSSGYTSSEIPSLQYLKYTPVCRSFTIGSMTVSTDNRWPSDTEDTRVTYYSKQGNCGTVRHPYQLFDTVEDALSAAKLLANEKNAEVQAEPEAINIKKLSNLHLPDAVTLKWNTERWGYYWVHMHFRRFIQEIIDSDDPGKAEDIITDLKWHMEYDFGTWKQWPDMLQSLHKSIALLHDVADNMDDTTLRGEIYAFLDSIAPEPAKERPETVVADTEDSE